MRHTRFILAATLTALWLAACAVPVEEPETPTPGEVTITVTPEPEESPAASSTPDPDPTPTELPALYPLGPDDFPEDVNPLTGLRVSDPAALARRPLLVKISNQSGEVRPQSGLGFADHVWMYQMEGWKQTRFTAVFYSQAPEFTGSIRSVRLIDTEHLVDMYDALLVISGGSIGMNYIMSQKDWYDRIFFDRGEWLQRMPDVPRENTARYHTLFAIPERIWAEADARGVNGRPQIQGLLFDETAPEDGVPTDSMLIDYPDHGPAQIWDYDAEAGVWLSTTEDQLDVRPMRAPDIDYLTGKQLAFENVVILYAEHTLADFIEDEPNWLAAVDIHLLGEGKAYLLRDGLRYEARWAREAPGDMMRLYTAEGDLLAFKPGRVWWHTAGTAPENEPLVEFSP